MCRHPLGPGPGLPFGGIISSRQLELLTLFYKLRDGGPERFSDLAKVTQPGKAVLGFKPPGAVPESNQRLLCCCLCLRALHKSWRTVGAQ